MEEKQVHWSVGAEQQFTRSTAKRVRTSNTISVVTDTFSTMLAEAHQEAQALEAIIGSLNLLNDEQAKKHAAAMKLIEERENKLIKANGELRDDERKLSDRVATAELHLQRAEEALRRHDWEGLKKAVEEKDAALARAQNEIDPMRRSLHTVQQERDDLRREKTFAESECQRLRAQLADSDRANTNLHVAVMNKEESIAQLQAQLAPKNRKPKLKRATA